MELGSQAHPPVRGAVRLAHGWRLVAGAEDEPGLVAEFLRPAVRAVPAKMARRVGGCTIYLLNSLERPEFTSRWRWAWDKFEIFLVTAVADPHDVAMELLVCVGQILWQKATAAEEAAWLEQLKREIEAGVTGEIDSDAFEAKRRLLAGPVSARSTRRLAAYAGASFAATAAEYVHCLWHDVRVRAGPEHLPAPWLRARLELLARWFPPNRGYRLFASEAGDQRGGEMYGASEASPA